MQFLDFLSLGLYAMSLIRLDKFISQKEGISRERAAILIKEGAVKIDGKSVTKLSFMVSQDKNIEVNNNISYVGRGYIKIEKAHSTFKLKIKNACVLDVGSSTGGFTQFLLEHGAMVDAVDVGKNQMDITLRNNSKVRLFEETNIKDFYPDKKYDLIVVDLSFISLTKVATHISNLLKENGEIFALIKPQFELGNRVIGKKGIVKDKQLIMKAVMFVIESFNREKLFLKNIDISPIQGKKGNYEILSLFSRNGDGNTTINDVESKLGVLL